MLLSDNDIRTEVACGALAITPFDTDLLQPASIDVRLGGVLRAFKRGVLEAIEPHAPGEYTTLVEMGSDYELDPGEFVLGTTVEAIGLSTRHAARLEGKSSLGRLGLMVHSTAGFIDPGFTGQITLELSNVAPRSIMLRPGMLIGQLSFMALLTPASAPYGSTQFRSRYQGQRGPVASRAAT